MRMFLALFGGVVAAFLCILAIEGIGHAFYAPPSDLNLAQPDDQARLMAAMPTAVKAMVLFAWFLGALVGAVIANRIARWSAAGWIVALLVVAAGIATMVMIPHPAWMWAGGIVLPLMAGWIAARWSTPRAHSPD